MSVARLEPRDTPEMVELSSAELGMLVSDAPLPLNEPEKLVQLSVFVEALNVRSPSVEDAVIVPEVRLVSTTLSVPDAALSVEPVLVRFAPFPEKLVQLSVFVEALNVRSPSVVDDVIVPLVREVRTTL